MPTLAIGGDMERLRSWARALKREALTLWFAARDARTPWLPRAIALCVAAYAFSPVDLIPDVIPVLGLLDDLILVPLGVALAVRLMPEQVLHDARAQAARALDRPVSRAGLVAILILWALAAWLAWRLVASRFAF